ncbi:MAG: MFS transporter [Opitutaceae bacterium]|nr:MFS transporter [Opitutaceae bacterium]
MSFDIDAGAVPRRPSGFRWVVCGLLLLVTANNYLDRQILGVMAPELIRVLGWTPEDYTSIVFWFQLAYALGFIAAGKFFDWAGTRLGFAVAVTSWSLAAVLHGAMGTVLGFKVVRFLLGLAEPSHMPGAIKVVAEWFPVEERALATGIFKSGSNLGAVLAPVFVSWILPGFGWRATFVAAAATGFVWLALWLWLYRPPIDGPRSSPGTRALAAAPGIPGAPRPTPWLVLLRRRETWAYVNFKFMTDAIWHWYLAMLPLFLSQKFDLGPSEYGPALVVVYLVGNLGSIGAGWLTSHWIRNGWDLTRARKFAMLLSCCLALPSVFVVYADHFWPIITLVALAHAAHQALTSNLFCTVSDLFPPQAVGSVVGFGGTAGQIGAMLMSLLSGVVLVRTGSLVSIFFVASFAYITAFVIFHVLVPRLEPLRLDGTAVSSEV